MATTMLRYQCLNCSFEATEAKNETATFSGVASTSDLDSQSDIIEAGAFFPIAQKSGGEPDVAMFRDHDRTQVVGGWKSFTQKGSRLHVEGELALEVEKARETYALLKRGYLSGLSVGYSIPDRNAVKYDDRNGRRTIKKATLRECSIVAMPANVNARVLSVKSEVAGLLQTCGLDDEDIEILMNEGVDALIEARKDAAKPYGDVSYADPGYQDDGVKRYPIHTEKNIRAAWSYINMPRNQNAYSADQVKKIKARIVAAWKDKIDPKGPPGADNSKEDEWVLPLYDLPFDELRVADEVRGLLIQLKGRAHV